VPESYFGGWAAVPPELFLPSRAWLAMVVSSVGGFARDDTAAASAMPWARLNST